MSEEEYRDRLRRRLDEVLVPREPPGPGPEAFVPDGADEHIGAFHIVEGQSIHTPTGLPAPDYQVHDQAHHCLAHFHDHALAAFFCGTLTRGLEDTASVLAEMADVIPEHPDEEGG